MNIEDLKKGNELRAEIKKTQSVLDELKKQFEELGTQKETQKANNLKDIFFKFLKDQNYYNQYTDGFDSRVSGYCFAEFFKEVNTEHWLWMAFDYNEMTYEEKKTIKSIEDAWILLLDSKNTEQV